MNKRAIFIPLMLLAVQPYGILGADYLGPDYDHLPQDLREHLHHIGRFNRAQQAGTRFKEALKEIKEINKKANFDKEFAYMAPEIKERFMSQKFASDNNEVNKLLEEARVTDSNGFSWYTRESLGIIAAYYPGVDFEVGPEGAAIKGE